MSRVPVVKKTADSDVILARELPLLYKLELVVGIRSSTDDRISYAYLQSSAAFVSVDEWFLSLS
jgi:hypothetical protein